MVWWREFGGGRLTPEDERAIVILRRFYGLSRGAASDLPLWERRLLVNGGLAMLRIEAGVGDDAPVAASSAAGGVGHLSAHDVYVLTTPGVEQ